MESIRKLSTIFNRKQKCQFAGLFIIEFIGSLLELLGVSMLIPFMEVVTDPSGLMEKSAVRKIMEIFQIHGERQLLIFIVGGMIIIYAGKNIYLTCHIMSGSHMFFMCNEIPQRCKERY